MKLRPIAVAVLALALPLTAAACGDDGDDGLSKAEATLAAKLQADGKTAEQADCIAGAFGDAGMTEADVDAIFEGDLSSLDADEQETYEKSASDCLGVDVSVPDGS